MPILDRPPCDEGVIRSVEAAAPCSHLTGMWVLAATILGSSMAFIDGSVVNVALPALQADLRATVADVQWVIEIYSLFLSALILVGGALGDRYGRRLIFGLGVALFTAASVGCGLSQSIGQLILARAVQGVGGAMLVPGSLAIISASFAEEDRGRAIGTWSGFSAITAGFGPFLGGLLIEHLSWRAIFFMNVPLAAAVIVILVRSVPESRDEAAARLDWLGGALATVGLGGVVYGLIESTTLGMSDPAVIAGLVVGFVGLIACVVAEARRRDVMMPLYLFRNRAFAGANLLTVFLYGALGEATFFLPFVLIQVHGYTAAEAGASFLPFILVMFFLSRWSGGLISRVGARVPLIAGPVIAGFGMALFALPGTGGSYWTTFFPAGLTLGLGMAIAVAPLTTVVMTSTDQRHAGVASGINNAASRVAGLVTIAGMSLVVLQLFTARLDDRMLKLRTPASVRRTIHRQSTRLADVPIPSGVGHALHAQLHAAIAQSFLDAFRVAVLVAAVLALLSAVVAAATLRGRRAEEPAREERLAVELGPRTAS